MSVTATQIFAFLDAHPRCSMIRHEVWSSDFAQLRRDLQKIAFGFLDSEDAGGLDLARRLRAVISGWLTMPVQFNSAVIEAITILGAAEGFERQWGRDLRLAYESAQAAAGRLTLAESPTRCELGTVLRQLKAGHTSFRIYCHRRAAEHFESLTLEAAERELCAADFLHSGEDFRMAAPFDVLVKFGPLRSRGWGSLPDAVLSAPRFQELVQVVWSGCGDEPDFGYDPASGSDGVPADRAHPSWDRSSRLVTNGEHAPEPDQVPPDELKLFATFRAGGGELRKSILIQLDDDYGMLLGRHARVLSLDPEAASEGVEHRAACLSLVQRRYLIRPVVADPDLGETNVGDGRYSRIWKEALRGRFELDPDGLCRNLRNAGISLLGLSNCIQHWCRPASTVIHAPQQRRHFEILINELGMNADADGGGARPGATFWKAAWREIAHSRGEAIQSGMTEHEVIEEQVIGMLSSLKAEVRQGLKAGRSFDIAIPPGHALEGTIRFLRIVALDEGYEAPDHILGTIFELKELEQWRV